MQPLQRLSAASYQLRLVLGAFLIIASFAIQFLGLSSAIAAQTIHDPKVIIAVDETSASCITTKTVSDPKTHKQISESHVRCVAGTQMGTRDVSLSQAQADQEAYVVYPSEHASSSVWKQWYRQVQQLMEKKSKSLHPTSSIHPNSCSDAGEQVTLFSGYNVVLNDYIESVAIYYVSSDCQTVYWDTAIANVGYVPYNNPVWWIGVAYANYSNVCGGFPVREFYPNSSYTMYPSAGQPLGYDAVYDYDSADLCGLQGGILRQIDLQLN